VSEIGDSDAQAANRSADVTGLILAGGQGRRMGGLDKGLVAFAGEPMIARVLRALAPQVGQVIINANRSRTDYEAFGCTVIPDAAGGYPGPLAGMAAGLGAIESDWLLTVPCDSPLLPATLCERMIKAAMAQGAEIAIASDGERCHPVFALIARGLGPSLDAFLAGDERKILRWMHRHRLIEVDFSDCPRRFSNVNTEEELRALEARLGGGHHGG